MKKIKIEQTKQTKVKLKDLNNNPNHSGDFDSEQVNRLASSIRVAGLMRPFAAFKIKDKYYLVSGHHTRDAAIKVYGKDADVPIEIHNYDEDTADWGMVAENITQRSGDKLRVAEELFNLKHRLHKRFPKYEDYAEFMKKKGTAVRIPTAALGKDKRHKVERAKGPQHYPQTDSSHFMEEWLNRQGEIISFQKINEHLITRDILSPELYSQIEVGSKNDKKKKKNDEDDDEDEDEEFEEEEEEKFNWTNAKNIATATRKTYEKEKKELIKNGISEKEAEKKAREEAHKEQLDLKKALENSNEERVHRSRTRSRLIAKYNKLKKKTIAGRKKTEEELKRDEKTIEAIRKGEKDISLTELPTVKLPSSITEKKPSEFMQELRDIFHQSKLEMDRQMTDKFYEKLSDKEVEMMIFYLKGWANNSFTPYISILMKYLAEKNNEDFNTVRFDFKNKK